MEAARLKVIENLQADGFINIPSDNPNRFVSPDRSKAVVFEVADNSILTITLTNKGIPLGFVDVETEEDADLVLSYVAM